MYHVHVNSFPVCDVAASALPPSLRFQAAAIVAMAMATDAKALHLRCLLASKYKIQSAS